MGAVLVEEAGGKGLQSSMGPLGRPSVDEGSCHRVLEEAGCLSGFRVCEELDKSGGFFAPSSFCFYAKDDEATSSAAQEFGVCTLLSASGFGQAVPAYCPALRRGWPSLVRGETMVVSTANSAPPQMERPFAITSMRRSSCLWMWSGFKFVRTGTGVPNSPTRNAVTGMACPRVVMPNARTGTAVPNSVTRNALTGTAAPNSVTRNC